MANIKVAVRVRPISVRELNLTGSEVVVRTDSSGISLTNLKVSSSKAGDSRERTRRYGFDYCFDSSDPQAENFATQARIYETLGQPVLDTVFDGYNSCLVAYGQSASGKTYTMMGTKEDPGLTPRLCNGLFARVEEEEKKGKTYRVSVSYLEIYNERVRDLLKPSTSPGGLRVREHPRLGPYVQGLTRHVVPTLGSLMSYVEEGTRARKTASTLQNPNSSRSHALLTVSISPESSSPGYSGVSSTSSSSTARRCEKPTARAGSKLHLVDLAGSESAATCGGVHRLKEGANINKSLVALGNVISALAERGSTGSGPGRRFIPYRDSSLTWLLKDALGGNATTIMLATISPASGSYNETAHTLRFAQRAQSVVNRPVVNEDPVARIIRELREEVARLKSLLLEKEAQSDTRLLCCCKESQSTDSPVKNLRETEEYSEAKGKGLKVEKTSNTSVRRSNSSEGLTAHEIDSPGPVKRYSSYEYLPLRDRFVGNYNRAKVTELNEEEDEVNESVFVDIPTLVAVLIKPDESLQEASTQIEEICSDDVAEDSIDADFLESGNDQEGFEDTEKPESIDHDERSSSVNSCHAPGDAEVGDFCRNSTEYLARGSSDSISKARERNKVRKQDSIDVVVQTIPSNLHTSKKFGSEEIIQKKKEPLFALERSHTNLEKRAGISERVKRLNNIREIDDQKTGGRIGCVWRTAGSKEHLQRKGSNDSDKSIKESGSNSGTRTKNYARKPSLENLKRKTSKDSSSSSSKEEQILISNLARDKLLRRKSSLEQEPPSVRAHTPIQRVKRAEIVAAVTERLYSSRKHSEENSASASAAGIRSPPEGTDVKSGSSVFPPKMKLQELSRKMLAKRRRVSTDTQTDFSRTIRMKDTASLTEEPKIECRDAAVLTDNHTSCNFLGDDRVPTLRVKEIATLTDKPKTHIVKCKDVACLANDLDEYEYEIHSLRNDSGILSDDTQNYAESNVSSAEASDLCPVSERRVVYTESSMNTVFTSPYRDSACQFPLRGVTSISTQNIVELPVQQHSMINIDAQRQEVAPSQPQHIASIPNHQYRGIASQHPEQSKTPSCTRPCCNISREPGQALSETNPDKNVISISLTDMISITVESTNILDSRIAVMEGLDVSDEKMKNSTTDSECQTDQNSEIAREAEKSRFSFKDFTRSTLSQTDGRVFRIENIFQDPNNMSRPRSKIDVGLGSADNTIQNSVIFTNSLGTSYASHVKETTGDRKIQGWDRSGEGRGSFVQDGLITEAFITKKRSSTLSPGCLPLASNSPWRNLTVPRPINSACCVGHGDNHDPPWWQLQNVPVNGLILPCKNCAPPLLPGDRQKLGQSQPGPNLINVKEAPGLNSTPSFGRLDEPDHEHNFSDDSLDYTVNDNMLKEPKNVRLGKEKCESRETLCPPDVVAHTKKENQKSTSHADKEVSFDFEESHVEFPKKKPGETMVDGQAPIHDYKSLILGNPVYNQYDSVPDEESDSTAISNRPRSVGKKKVSFFGCTSPRRRNDGKDVKPAKSGSMLKSIIKKKKVDIVESVEISSNEETDDSVRQGAAKVTSVGEGGHPRSRSKLSSSEESSGSRENLEPGNVPASLKGSARRGVKFSGRDFSEDSCTESSSCSDADSEEGIPSKRCTRNILEEYLDEAVIFMRNMNSINEYMSATRMFEKYIGRGSKRRGGRRRVRPFCDQDYVEFQGRRVSLEDDTDKYLRVEDDDAVVSTEPYDRCLKGIKRLENCIQRADKHDEILREKYSLDWESAGARLSLASPCIDPSLAGRGTESATANSEDLIQDTNAYSPSIGPSTETGVMEQSADDLEKRIFDQLMNVVDSSRCRTTRRLLPPATYSKSRSFSRHVPVEPLTGNEDARTHLTESSPEEEDSSAPINRAARLTTVGIARETLDTGENVFVRARTSTDERLGSPMRTEIPREPGIKHEQDSSEKVGPKNRAHFPRQRIISRNTRERDTEECSRRIRDGVSETRTSPLARSEASDLETSSDPITADSIDGIAHFRDKLKYPGSPRARFLELLRERRRIVESSRGTSAS